MKKNKKDLYPYFAYLYLNENHPDDMKGVSSEDEFASVVDKYKTEIDKASEAYKDWDQLDQLAASMEGKEDNGNESDNNKQDIESAIQSAKNGAKLTKIKNLKSKKKMCANGGKCGCDVDTKKKGGTVKEKIDDMKDKGFIKGKTKKDSKSKYLDMGKKYIKKNKK